VATPPKVLDLIEVFDRNAADYRSADFKEAMLRQQFINPFFKCLGWDMENEQGYAEAYKDVIHEASLKIGGETKAPDYCFRIGGTPKFYLEAKKPSVNIKDDPAPAFQLRRYGWSKKLPLSILTNFEEFTVYDCRIRPAQTDKASVARILSLRYTDYGSKWDQIAGVYSREAILKGSFDKYADSTKVKRGTATVDTAFLEEIENWREELAKNFALRNPQLSSRDLNFAVQMTIDRLIFLRMCEDRGIKPYGQLKSLLNDADVYDELCKLYRKADDRYNSGLFHFHKEKERAEAPDELTTRLQIDDKVLKQIVKRSYYPDSPYEFSVLPAEILGQVYEQFLGKVIRLTAGHQAKVEEKPEVKKAGGVYYTPAYIVDYIVKHTVGPLLEGKTPKQAAKLRILDPACGSGSFLLGAYQHLLAWHLEQYLKDSPEKHKKELFQAPGGDWRLTTGERKRILLNNIYGVDIDPQAVEVTKLSLLLKVLEGESQQSIDTQRKLFHERALPDLASNIKCGNSLIGPDFYEGQQMMMFDEEEQYRVNVFDWNAAFPWLDKVGGFDAVIGNPPYIRIQTMQEISSEQVSYLKPHYQTAGSGNHDIYVVFVEKGLSLLNKQGLLGFILPSKFFATDYGYQLRNLITQRKALAGVIDFGHAQVFESATTYTCLLFLSATPVESVSYAKVTVPPTFADNAASMRRIDTAMLTGEPWMFSTDVEKGLADKLSRNAVALKDLPARIGRGSSSGADDVFILRQEGEKLFTRQGHEVEIESAMLRVPIYATDFGSCPISLAELPAAF
jgi:type I restriction-modification system DNA methylase subunit